MVNALNANNTSIPKGASVVEFYYPSWGDITGCAFCSKVNNNYGGAVIISYYANGAEAAQLVGGTWAAV